jgi:hypothetical protein
MEAVGLLTRGKVTPGYYPTLTLISWGFLYFRLPVFDVPGDFVPGFITPVPIAAPPVFFTNYAAAQLIGNTINQPGRLSSTPVQVLSNMPDQGLSNSPPAVLNDSSIEVDLIPDDPSKIHMISTVNVGLAHDGDSNLLPNDDDTTLLPTVEPDLVD